MDKKVVQRVCRYIVDCGALCKREITQLASAIGYVRDTDNDDDLRYRRIISESLIAEQNRKGE